jgi:hypothetical protein
LAANRKKQGKTFNELFEKWLMISGFLLKKYLKK